MKKIVRVEVIAEMEVDTDWYEDESNIIEHEKNNWPEWINENIISDKISVRDLNG